MRKSLKKLGLVLVALIMVSCSTDDSIVGGNPNGDGSNGNGQVDTPTPTECQGSLRYIKIWYSRGHNDTLVDQTTNGFRSQFNTMGYDIQCGEIKTYNNQPPVGSIDLGTNDFRYVRIIDCR